jgi:hypothetical protein
VIEDRTSSNHFCSRQKFGHYESSQKLGDASCGLTAMSFLTGRNLSGAFTKLPSSTVDARVMALYTISPGTSVR